VIASSVHRGEGAENADDPGGGSALDPEHVIDQGEGVAAAQLPHRPLLQGNALDLYVEDAADAVLVGGVGALGARMARRPGGEILAQGVRAV
jgi:hypothetical protein